MLSLTQIRSNDFRFISKLPRSGKDLYDKLKSVLESLLQKIIGISTDGARAISSMKARVSTALFR